ncbi:MAG TPA: DnaJ domain-containing protein [bacterium]|nr:DnaJ domain-containing protein [bacterium]HPS31495.1 DnaJ domain-containing protein [bacterium]
MKTKIIILMNDEKYLRSLEKFISSKVTGSEVFATTEVKELAAIDLPSCNLMIVSSLINEGVWLKALPVIRKVQNFILLGMADGPELSETIAQKYGAAAYFRLPLSSDALLKSVNEVLEKSINRIKIPDIITKDFVDTITEFFAAMDKYNYYEFFGLKKDCTAEEVKKNYIAMARKYHPDKFRNVPSEIKNMSYEITKRANEAYSVLSHPNRKSIYDKMLIENVELKRFDFRMKVAYDENPEDTVQNEQARRFARLAKKAMDQNDFKSALTQLKMAISMEKNSTYLAKLMDEVKKNLGISS